MKANGWANPENWFPSDINPGGSVSPWNDNAIHENGRLNLKYPFVIDPLSDTRVGVVNGRYLPNFEVSGANVFFTRVTPKLGNNNRGSYIGREGYLDARFERIFYLPDDLASGYDESEDDTQFRPFLELEQDAVLNNGDVPAFTGRYSWMATVYPYSNTEPFDNCASSDIDSAVFDVVVFKDRSMNDERVMSVTVDGTGYQGGSVTLDLSSMSDHDIVSRTRVLAQLETTKYIMLMGDDDVPVDGAYRKFARWYRIANYGVDDEKDPQLIRLSLVGPDTPTLWHEKSVATPGFVSGVFFPGVVGVYSGSTSF